MITTNINTIHRKKYVDNIDTEFLSNTIINTKLNNILKPTLKKVLKYFVNYFVNNITPIYKIINKRTLDLSTPPA